MFPRLWESIREEAPEVYFWGSEVPEYLHLRTCTSVPPADLVSMIRSIGEGGNASGYIDGEGVHVHLAETDFIQVDRSKRFVFISQPSVRGTNAPTPWQVLQFLEDPVRSMLLVFADSGILFSKTGRTLTLCQALDELWDDAERFLETNMEMLASEEGRNVGLSRLMRAYEEERFGSASSMWFFWDTFGPYLMQHALFLDVVHFS